MSEIPKFEIPKSVREMAEQNVEQARSAYNQFMDMARQAQDAATKSQGAMAASALEIQMRAMRYAEENIDAGFKFASELAQARDFGEIFEIQQRHTQKQIQSFASQAQDLGQMMAKAAEKAKSGT